MTGEQLKVFTSCTARVRHQHGHGTGFFVAPELVLTCYWLRPSSLAQAILQ
jgi:hypothetical protein